MVRRGFSSALDVLLGSILKGKEEEVIHALIKCSEGTEKWAEARRDAVKALGSIVFLFTAFCLLWRTIRWTGGETQGPGSGRLP